MTPRNDYLRQLETALRRSPVVALLDEIRAISESISVLPIAEVVDLPKRVGEL